VLGSRNDRLIELLCNDLYHLIRLYRHRATMAPGRSREALEEHRHILSAIRNRDGQLAERLMRDHIAAANRYLSSDDGLKRKAGPKFSTAR
jgi:DNA-binding GntR family transcriptional regulator